MTSRLPYPSTVYDTDFARMSGLRIRAAYLMRSSSGGINAHTAWLFVTEDNRIIIARGGAENEPRAEFFGLGLLESSIRQRMGLGSIGGTPDFGRLIPTIQELSEVALRTGDRRSRAEDLATHTLDTCNFRQIIQGLGIDAQGRIRGLIPRSNVDITPVEMDPRRAQIIFNAALDVTRMLHDAQFAYNAMPQDDGRTGINSHTMAALIAERADQMSAGRGLMTRYLQAFGDLNGISPGSSMASGFFTGPGYHRVRTLAGTQYALNPAYGRWRPGMPRQPIPRDRLMPYSQGLRGELAPDLHHHAMYMPLSTHVHLAADLGGALHTGHVVPDVPTGVVTASLAAEDQVSRLQPQLAA